MLFVQHSECIKNYRIIIYSVKWLKWQIKWLSKMVENFILNILLKMKKQTTNQKKIVKTELSHKNHAQNIRTQIHSKK